MTTHYQMEASDRLREICPLLPECAAQIGDVQVRNKGTIGGSVAHSDPAADWPAAIIALGAEMVAVGANGERVIKADDFFVDMLTTALEPGEILREISNQRANRALWSGIFESSAAGIRVCSRGSGSEPYSGSGRELPVCWNWNHRRRVQSLSGERR